MNPKSLPLLLLLLSSTAHAARYTYPDLVSHLTNLQLLAKLLEAGEKTSLASSYDRASQYDPATDKYIRWDANGDGGGMILKEVDESVFMDVQGLGCIWRTWSATAATGHVKIFLDGEKFPSSFGTGSEDYFGYAWSSAGHFSRPYHNQILNEGNQGHFDDNRFHIVGSSGPRTKPVNRSN
jgi:hypothetical protein